MGSISKYINSLLITLTKIRREYIKKRDVKNILLKIFKFFVIPKNYTSTAYIYLGAIKIRTRVSSFKMKATGGSLENELFWKGIYKSLEPENCLDN